MVDGALGESQGIGFPDVTRTPVVCIRAAHHGCHVWHRLTCTLNSGTGWQCWGSAPSRHPWAPQPSYPMLCVTTPSIWGFFSLFQWGVRTRHHPRTDKDQVRQGQASGACDFQRLSSLLFRLAWPQDRGQPSQRATVFSRLCEPFSGPSLRKFPVGSGISSSFSPVFPGLPHFFIDVYSSSRKGFIECM